MLTRRSILRGSAAAGLLTAAGCGGTTSYDGSATAWKRYAGTKLTFLSENTSPTAAIAANVKPFHQLTGIEVQIQQLELSSMAQRLTLDFASHGGQYQIVYADPNQVLAPLSKGFADLRTFIRNRDLPKVPRGLQDFVPVQLRAAGYFEKRLLALPYDCPTIIWCYRKDLFDKYHDRMRRDLGFDPTPSARITWPQYQRISRWFTEHVDEVPYGDGHMAKQYDSLLCDFSSVLWAYGGDYFKGGQRIGAYGTTDPGPCTLDSEEAIRAATFYRDLVGDAHPGSTSWDWNDLAEAFGDGACAMCPEFHEDAAAWEAGGLKGKVGFAPLPTGPARSANIYGGTGLGINTYAPQHEQEAAWLFLLWATSPSVQLADLKSAVGGGTPTRQSVYRRREVQKNTHAPSNMPNMLAYHAVAEAWKPHNIGLRPKIPRWNQVETVVYSQLSAMLTGGQTPEETMRACVSGINRATKGGSSAV